MAPGVEEIETRGTPYGVQGGWISTSYTTDVCTGNDMEAFGHGTARRSGGHSGGIV